MSSHHLTPYHKHEIVPHCRDRHYIRQYLRLPLHRRQIIRKIADTTLRKTIAKSSCFLLPPEPSSPKRYPSSRSPGSLPSERRKLRFGQFRARQVKVIDTIKRSLPKKKLRMSTEAKQQDMNELRAIIDKIVVNNRNRQKLSLPNIHIPSEESEQCCNTITGSNLKETQQYYNIKKYYEQKYSSCK